MFDASDLSDSSFPAGYIADCKVKTMAHGRTSYGSQPTI